jgi:Asp-tRNA(Asn)/Glu-tRNA(Gln) amidotransferase A subunit family amidase
MGLQIVARRHDDRLALRIGATLEQRTPWVHRRPPV